MIKKTAKFRMMDEAKQSDFFIDVNWEDNPRTNECKVLRFTFPDGKTAYVKREHLHSVLFALSSPEEQAKLIPKKLTHVKWYETVVSVKPKRDIHKGELLTFPIKISLPPVEETVIGR